MMSSLRLAGAAALCAAILLSACAKKTDQTTTTTTGASSATVAPAADAGAASAAPNAAATAASGEASVASAAPTTAAAGSTTTATSSGSNGASSGGYITLPVYPGASEAKDNGSMSISTNTGSLAMKSYTTSDDGKKVADWYKAHLPASFKNMVFTSDNKTSATFVEEHPDGDQSVLVTTQDVTTTRIQLTTKHGK